MARRLTLAPCFLCVCATVLATGCGESQVCPLVGCETDVLAYSILDTPLDEPVQLYVRACRNGACGEAAFDSVNGGPAILLTRAGGGGSIVDCEVNREEYHWDYDVVVPDRWLLTIEYRWTGEARDGDLIELAVTDESTGRSTEISKAVNYRSYRRTQCLVCDTTSFEFPPP